MKYDIGAIGGKKGLMRSDVQHLSQAYDLLRQVLEPRGDRTPVSAAARLIPFGWGLHLGGDTRRGDKRLAQEYGTGIGRTIEIVSVEPLNERSVS